jgi:hypothetical protein
MLIACLKACAFRRCRALVLESVSGLCRHRLLPLGSARDQRHLRVPRYPVPTDHAQGPTGGCSQRYPQGARSIKYFHQVVLLYSTTEYRGVMKFVLTTTLLLCLSWVYITR